MKNPASETETKIRRSQLEEFFIESLKDLYWAEKQLTRAIPRMIEAATTEELQEVMTEHVEETRQHVLELEYVFGLMHTKPQTKKCEAIEGLISEAENMIEQTEEGSMTRDVALIMAAQKIEHYEISSYGTMVRLAKTMARYDVADVLTRILDQEKEANMTLTGVAENNINVEAMQEVPMSKL